MSTSTLPDWAAEHMKNYLATDGEDGHIWRGVPTLLLTTTGRKSGAPRMLPLIYGKHGDDVVIIASKGGHADHPSWYVNLHANPAVEVQVAADKFSATAITITDERRQAMWNALAEIWPPYIEYQEKTDRQIPVVLLQRN
ncbi:nitroreductase family deazaflavin-dependent oxidoreductase [Pseudomonadales bacterium]|nr:nitroreductase family deazaflavin-dependent oxidoreductase [Pseudomonadales bacterium]